MAHTSREFPWFTGLSLLLCGPGLGCQGEDIAPLCSVVDDKGQCADPSPGLVLSLDCRQLPRAVRSANYEYVIQHPGLPPGHKSMWEATGLPPGLVMEQGGILRGRPEQVGVFSDIQVTMRDVTAGQSKTVSCGPLQVFEALSLDLSQTRYGCVSHGDRVQDFVRGGTDEALFCQVPTLEQDGGGCPHGLGNGRMPAGLSVQKDCMLSGEIDPVENKDGTYVWIVELRQSGAQLFVPFCATAMRPIQHKVTRNKGGQPLERYQPIHFNFNPDEPLRAGTKIDPRVRVTAACEQGSCATRGISVRGTCSPFDAAVDQLLDGSTEAAREDGRLVGLSHGFDLHSFGRSAQDLGLGQRPFVLSLESTYCTSAANQPDPCMAPTTLRSDTTVSFVGWPSTNLPNLPAASGPRMTWTFGVW